MALHKWLTRRGALRCHKACELERLLNGPLAAVTEWRVFDYACWRIEGDLVSSRRPHRSAPYERCYMPYGFSIMAEYRLEDASFAIGIAPRHRLVLAGNFGVGGS